MIPYGNAKIQEILKLKLYGRTTAPVSSQDVQLALAVLLCSRLREQLFRAHLVLH